MYDIIEFLKSRRSVREFDQSRTIPEDIIQRILEAGVIAPSAKNSQPWHFYILVSEESRENIRKCYTKEWFQHVPVYIMIVGDETASWTYADKLANTVYTDGAIATTHMMLEAWSLGVGSTWVCDFDRVKCCELFGLELEVNTPLNILALGYPKDDPRKLPLRRKDYNQVVSKL